jgi:8-oxo-dGTP diphosphatase
MKMVLVVAVALYNEHGEILLAQRPPGKQLEGLWEFPGGKVDPGETPETALVRELQEELAITVEINQLQPITFASHTYETFHLLMPLYACRTWSGTATGAEGQALAWVPPGRLEEFPAPPADIPLFRLLATEKHGKYEQDHPPGHPFSS